MGVHKASVIDAADCIRHLCLSISCIDGSALWGEGMPISNFPTRPALWEALVATLNAFYERGVPLEDLNDAVIEAGWPCNPLSIVKGKVVI